MAGVEVGIGMGETAPGEQETRRSSNTSRQGERENLRDISASVQMAKESI
jgi:hypothetical protein